MRMKVWQILSYSKLIAMIAIAIVIATHRHNFYELCVLQGRLISNVPYF